MINGPHVALLQLGQEKILRELVDMLMNWAKRDNHRLPGSLRQELYIAKDLRAYPDNVGFGKNKFADRGDPNRIFLDFICTLSDAQCISLHEKLSGRRLHKAGLAMEL